MPSIKVMIVDDHPLARQGLRQILSLEDNLSIVGEAQNGNEVLQKVADLRPDVILMDMNLPGKNGIELTQEIKADFADINILVLTVESDQSQMQKVIKAGASGYALKDISPTELAEAIKLVANNDAYIQPCLLSRLLDEFRQCDPPKQSDVSLKSLGFTQREEEILQFLVSGKSNKEIAEQLFISEKTVKNHVSSMLRKTALNDRTQLAVYAYQQNLVSR